MWITKCYNSGMAASSIKGKKRLVLLDTHAILHRAYHATPPLTTSKGELVNAVYGFTTILLRVVRELKPDYMAVTFDAPGKNFRHAMYKEYKATRQKMPEDLGAVIKEHYLNDRPYAEIASNNDISVAALKMKLFRARKKFKEVMDEIS